MAANKSKHIETIDFSELSRKEQLVQEIMSIAFMANKQSPKSFGINYAPHVDALSLTVATSKELYNDWLYRLDIYVNESPVEELLIFKETLLDLSNGEELDMDMFTEKNYKRLRITEYSNDPPHDYSEEKTGDA